VSVKWIWYGWAASGGKRIRRIRKNFSERECERIFAEERVCMTMAYDFYIIVVVKVCTIATRKWKFALTLKYFFVIIFFSVLINLSRRVCLREYAKNDAIILISSPLKHQSNTPASLIRTFMK
jgi:hypothetical protein